MGFVLLCGTYIATYFNPLFILVKATSNKNLSVDSTYEAQDLWVHLNSKPIYLI